MSREQVNILLQILWMPMKILKGDIDEILMEVKHRDDLKLSQKHHDFHRLSTHL